MSAESATQATEELKTTTAKVEPQKPSEEQLTAKEQIEASAAAVEAEDKKAEDAATIEGIAREWGHQSREEFEADPKNEGKEWVNAATFVRNQRAVADSIKKGSNTLQRKVDELRKDVTGLVESNKQAQEREKAARKEAVEARKLERDKLLEQLEEQHEEAVEEGDKDAAKEIAQKMAKLQVEKATQPEVAEEETETDAGKTAAEKKVVPEVEAWLEQNSIDDNPERGWYGHFEVSDPRFDAVNAACTDYADRRVEELGKDNPTWSLDQVFAQVDKEVAAYREKLGSGQQKKQTRTASPAGNGTPAGSDKKVSVNDLSELERKHGEQFVKMGRYKNLQEYAEALEKL